MAVVVLHEQGRSQRTRSGTLQMTRGSREKELVAVVRAPGKSVEEGLRCWHAIPSSGCNFTRACGKPSIAYSHRTPAERCQQKIQSK